MNKAGFSPLPRQCLHVALFYNNFLQLSTNVRMDWLLITIFLKNCDFSSHSFYQTYSIQWPRSSIFEHDACFFLLENQLSWMYLFRSYSLAFITVAVASPSL